MICQKADTTRLLQCYNKKKINRRGIMEFRFELKKTQGEVKEKKDIFPGCAEGSPANESELVKSFGNKNDAEAALKDMTMEAEYDADRDVWKVTDYFIEANIYDDDGEWDDGGDICDFARLPENF